MSRPKIDRHDLTRVMKRAAIVSQLAAESATNHDSKMMALGAADAYLGVAAVLQLGLHDEAPPAEAPAPTEAKS